MGNTVFTESDVEKTVPLPRQEDTDDEGSEESKPNVEDDIIVLTRRQTRRQREGVTSKPEKWPGGIIPYKISSEFGLTDKKMIKEAIDTFHENTCIRFRSYADKDTDYIYIISSTNRCSSYVGRNGGAQELNLTIDCIKRKGSIIHELMHAVGFHHEHCRPDRDYYVTVMWENIENGKESNFEKYASSEFDTFGVSYDYSSVMHYKANAFSRNNKPTIIVKGNKNVEMGQAEGLSKKDIQKIRKMYECKVYMSN